MTMIQCRECGAEQYEGAIFCSECGRFLMETSGDQVNSTTRLPFNQFVNPPVPPPLAKEALRPTDKSKRLIVVIPSSRRRMTFELDDDIHIGRADPDAEVHPEVDLSDDQGGDQGVSRNHAQIKLAEQGVILIDLDSTNGTFLNNYPLQAHQPYILKSGDEVQFGDLLVHILFD